MFDGKAFGAEIVEIVRAYVDEQTSPLRAEIIELRAQLAAQPTPRDGLDGKDAELPDIQRMVAEEVARIPLPEKGEAGPAGEKGEAGQDGASIDPAEVQRMVDEAVANLPAAKDGEPGKDADPEHIAELVRASTDAASADILARVEALIPTQVHKAVASIEPVTAELHAEPVDYDRIVSEVRALIPAPENGKDADPAETAAMVAAEVAKAVGALPVAKDGVSVAGALLDRSGSLVLTLSDGTTRDLGCVVGKDGLDGTEGPAGKDGANGRDGFSLSDFDTELLPDGRTLRFKFVSGDTVETHDIQLAIVLDRGVFRTGETYEQGDGATWGGSYWIAQEKTASKPGEDSTWRLAVKKGRDGKDGKDGERGPEGKQGLPGLNGRNL